MSFSALMFSVFIVIYFGHIFAEDNLVNETSGFKDTFQNSTTATNINSNYSASFENATKYAYVRGWGSEGYGDGQFHRIHDLDFDPSESLLYVVDRDNHRIQVFDKSGNFKFKWGSDGKGDGQFHVPYSVDVDSAGNVWVADRNNNRIQKFDKDGNFLFKFGSPGSGTGEFNLPRQIAVDRNIQFLYVVDSENHRVQVFDSNGKNIKQ